MILKCRSCYGESISNIMSFGFTPLANSFLTASQRYETEERYPLDLVFCKDCSLVQIVETVNPKNLFKNYFYTSSVSDTTLKNAKDITDKMIELMGLGLTSTVVEIGSNDGYLLKNYAERGILSIGIDPADNLKEVSQSKGVTAVSGFFSLNKAKELIKSGYRADVIHANNVLAHVADLHGVIEGIYHLLKPDGVAVIETHYVKDMVENGEFDCVYHEHLCYYSAHSIENLFALHGMKMVRVEEIPIHGGSLRVMFQRADGPCSLLDEEEVTKFLAYESHLTYPAFYETLPRKAQELKEALLKMMWELKISGTGRKMAMYGAPAKSTTFLSYMGIGKNLIDFVVDRTPSKQGHFTPGTHLPIYSPDVLATEKPHYLLLATWNFADEILERQSDYLASGGRFIIPIPELRIAEYLFKKEKQ